MKKFLVGILMIMGSTALAQDFKWENEDHLIIVTLHMDSSYLDLFYYNKETNEGTYTAHALPLKEQADGHQKGHDHQAEVTVSELGPQTRLIHGSLHGIDISGTYHLIEQDWRVKLESIEQ